MSAPAGHKATCEYTFDFAWCYITFVLGVDR
jgi:hypothetical protein